MRREANEVQDAGKARRRRISARAVGGGEFFFRLPRHFSVQTRKYVVEDFLHVHEWTNQWPPLQARSKRWRSEKKTSSRKILPDDGPYRVERMETKNIEEEQTDARSNFHLDPNRVRTEAEIQLFADVFRIGVEEARQILTKAGKRCQS